MEQKKCSCGHEYNINDKYCVWCGKKNNNFKNKIYLRRSTQKYCKNPVCYQTYSNYDHKYCFNCGKSEN